MLSTLPVANADQIFDIILLRHYIVALPKLRHAGGPGFFIGAFWWILEYIYLYAIEQADTPKSSRTSFDHFQMPYLHLYDRIRGN